MLRHTRIVLMVLVAMFVAAVPTAVAQVPVTDQYQVPDDAAPGAAGGGGQVPAGAGAAPGEGAAGAAPVRVADRPSAVRDSLRSLPFTGGQISLIALIGLALLALGAIGLAATRRREPASAS